MAVNTLTLYMPGSSVGIQVYEGSQLHLILVSQGANSIPSAPGQTVRKDPFPQYVDDDELAAALAGIGGGGGAVDSVNGQTGVVVLDADDVGAATAEDLAGKADLVAGQLPEAQLPARLSDASLSAAFAASDAPGFTGYHRGRSDKTASFTMTASDVGALTVVTSGSGTTATLPTPSSLGVGVGQAVTIQQGGAGVVTLTPGAGCTLRNRAGSFVTGGQYAAVDAIAWSTSEWWISGEVA